ncbi:hypothetical protein GYMLUDRAFT_85036 [Collybiopsis luxurians FD-317 M1]|uniref:Unplaced genomic scaffold GYMLUscaffold_24, whole genome shotgun sequence n=1 Tax=Collybiopsis luxurians FD-317 M1 TaxID=944289 RepID=A0A0D0CQ06_9AGAR|nr:hypothetical protein GYMLUDRAFT_85036 [Collybiopsis luxurians FD-317 M1]
MPAARSWARRKSSLGLVSLPPAKPGIYGVNLEPSRLTFCPNVTPTTFKTEADAEDMYDDSPGDDSSATLFPPSSTPAPPQRRRRAPPGKRRSLGYIPRPPNAFMLFRADFVKQKHVPNSIETNHSSLSKIIGSCWRSLPAEEKAIWEKRARAEKAEHKRKYPEYRFRPVHNKNKNKGADTAPPNKKMKTDPLPATLASMEAMRTEREGFIAQCLLDGLKSDALKERVKQWDDLHGWDESAEGMAALEARAATPQVAPTPDLIPPPPAAPVARYPRRPSSVPLPNDYLPFQTGYQQTHQFFPHSDATFSHIADSSHGLSMDLAGYAGMAVGQSSFNMIPPLNNALRPPSPSPNNFDVGSISRQQRIVLGGRRASSAQAFVNYGRTDDSWPVPNSNWSDMHSHWAANWQTGYEQMGPSPSSSASSLPPQTEMDELPDTDTSLFQPGFAFGTSSLQASQPQSFESQQQCNPFEGFSMDQQHVYQQLLHEQQNHVHNPHNLSLAPLDTQSYSPLDTSPLSTSSVQSYSSPNSGSPVPTDRGEGGLTLHAPQPVHPTSIDDVDLVYSDSASPVQHAAEGMQTHPSSGDITSSSTLSAHIDSTTAFNELWKGLSSSGSFAAAMGFPMDSTAQHVPDYSYQSTMETMSSTVSGINAFAGEGHDEFQQMFQAQHEHLAMETGC